MNLMTFLGGISEMLSMGYFHFALLNRRYKMSTSILLYTLFAVITMTKHFYLYDAMGIRSLIQWGLNILMVSVLFTDSFRKKIGTIVLYVMTVVIIEAICMMSAEFFLNQSVFAEHGEFSPMFIVEMTVIPFVVYAETSYINRKKMSFGQRSHLFVMLYCFMQFFTAYIMLVMLWDYKIRATPLMVFYFVMLTASVLFGIYLLRMMRTASAEQARADRMALQVKLANEHFGRLQVQYEQYRKLRHDYYNHINVIRNITDTEKREAYIDELTHKIEDRNGIAFCSNAALDALLFNEKAQADAAGVKITYKIGDLSEVKIPDLDICTVLSNLLDNAVRGASECESERFVELVMTVSAGQLVIRVTNSAVAPKEDLSTTKKDKDKHGLGLSIVRETAEKYHGAAVWSYENGVFCCTFSAQA